MNETQFKALPLAQRKAIQQQLKDQGLYAGGIDGEYGAGTETAFRLRQEAEARASQQEREGQIAQTQAEAAAERARAEAEQIRAEAEASRQQTATRQQYSEQANSPEGVATKIAANTVAPLAGVAAGRGMGTGINRLADASQESRNRALQGAAQDRMAGVTTREGARVGTERSGAMPSSNSALRVGGRMLPHMIGGGAMIGKGGAMLSDDSGEAFYADQANRAAGLGMIGTGAGMIEKGAAYAVNPGVSPDARSIAIMESNQIRRNAPGSVNKGAVDTPPNRLLSAAQNASEPVPTAPAASQKALPAPANAEAQRHAARLGNAVRAAGGKATRLKADNYKALSKVLTNDNAAKVAAALDLPETATRSNILQRARELLNTRGVSSVMFPLAAGAFAYGMSPEDAQAGTGGSITGQDEALTNAGIAAGATYGANKLLGAIPKVVGTAFNQMGPAMGPAVIDEMTSTTQPERNTARNFVARNLPEFMQVGAQGEARDMAQVPTPNPARAEPEDFEAQIADLQQLFTDLDGDGIPDQVQPAPQAPPAYAQPQANQNRLLSIR